MPVEADVVGVGVTMVGWLPVGAGVGAGNEVTALVLPRMGGNGNLEGSACGSAAAHAAPASARMMTNFIVEGVWFRTSGRVDANELFSTTNTRRRQRRRREAGGLRRPLTQADPLAFVVIDIDRSRQTYAPDGDSHVRSLPAPSPMLTLRI